MERQIDITKQDLNCCDEIMIEDDHINMEYELWFDVDAYFGTATAEDEDAWVNFYTNWYPETDTIKAWYDEDYGDVFMGSEWELTEKETVFFKQKMEEYCKKQTGKSLRELWEEHNNEN